MKSNEDKTPLRRAVDWLKKQGKIKRDNDLEGIFGLTKSTISTYLSGKPSIDFPEMFEKRFNISLKDFQNTPKTNNMDTPNRPQETKPSTTDVMLAELLSINRTYAAAHKDLTEAHLRAMTNYSVLTEKVNKLSIENEQKENYSTDAAMLRGLREVLFEVATGKRFQDAFEVEARLNKAVSAWATGNTLNHTQSDSGT